MTVYILYFDGSLGSDRHRASTYVGWCENGKLDRRIREHKKGRGAALTRAAVERGIKFYVAVILPYGTREDEKRIKAYKNTRRWVRNNVPVLRQPEHE